MFRHSLLGHGAAALLPLDGGACGGPAGYRRYGRPHLRGSPHPQHGLPVLVLGHRVQHDHLLGLSAEVGDRSPQRDLGLSDPVVLVELPVVVEDLEHDGLLLNIIRGELQV